jgi:hypothetical protein
VAEQNGGSPWDKVFRLVILRTDSKQFYKTIKRTMNVKSVRFADPENVVGCLLHFGKHESDDNFVPDKQPNDDPPALPRKLAESVKPLYSIRMADLPKMHRTLDHSSRSKFADVFCQALSVYTLPKYLQNATDLVHDHGVICLKSSRPVPRPRVALQSVHQP